MAPEESAGNLLLLRSFERRFLAARPLCSFPWQRLEEKLKESPDPEVLREILQKPTGYLRQSPSSSHLCPSSQTVNHPVCAQHPPSGKYTRCFLLELIRKHEAAHTEPLDELYEALAKTLTAEGSTQCHRSYLLPSGTPLTLSESTAIVSHGTTGLVTWDAALYLAEWAIENPEAFTYRTVLELGSGAGLTGLAICKMCHPKAYIFSDCHSRVLEQLRGNLLLNGLSLEPDATTDPEKPLVMVAQLDWEVATVPELSAFQPDIVIAADVLYCPEVILSLIGVLKRLAACSRNRAPDVYVAYTTRNPETCQLFTTELGHAGIRWEVAPAHQQKLFPYEEHSETSILKITL